jgi:hypothetical protein
LMYFLPFLAVVIASLGRSDKQISSINMVQI